ncbi:MAG: hypothetical protein L3J09_03460 [Flavobacteriaceae bacterium]|nr:hypothetical protein [Flavobacteriaceae bacterium]
MNGVGYYEVEVENEDEVEDDLKCLREEVRLGDFMNLVTFNRLPRSRKSYSQ